VGLGEGLMGAGALRLGREKKELDLMGEGDEGALSVAWDWDWNMEEKKVRICQRKSRAI